MRKLKVTELGRLTPEEYRASEKLPVVVVLDEVRSLNNVGSVFRTADAFRLEGVWLCGITATPPHAEIHKTALGAEETVEELRREGYVICALEQAEGSLSLDRFRPERGRKYAVVIGHEVKGVSQRVVDRSDVCIEIPQRGTKHSLNVSVAAGIVLWEFFKGLTPSESLLGSQENLAGIP